MESDSPRHPQYTVRIVSIALLSVCVVVPNVCALLSMSRTRGIPINIKLPVMNLILSDILSGLSLAVRVIISLSDPTTNHAPCLFLMAWTMTTGAGSLLIVSSIAVDRCICLYFEYAYITKVTARVVSVTQAMIWGLSLFYACIMFADYAPDYTDTRCIIMYTGSFGRSLQLVVGCMSRLLALTAYVLINIKIRKMEKAEQTNGLHTKGTFNTTYKLLLIGMLFHIMYLPYLCLNMYLAVYPERAIGMDTFFTVAGFIAIMNGFINPFIFAWRFPECRAELKKIMCFFNKKTVHAENEKRKRILVSFLELRSKSSDA